MFDCKAERLLYFLHLPTCKLMALEYQPLESYDPYDQVTISTESLKGIEYGKYSVYWHQSRIR